MRIGILCAGDTELEPFLACMEDCTITEKTMLKFYEGTLQGVAAVALYSGVCKVNAAIAAQILIDTSQVDAVINAGTAGGRMSGWKFLIRWQRRRRRITMWRRIF